MGESVEESMSKAGEIRFGQSHRIMAFMCPERQHEQLYLYCSSIVRSH